MPFKIVETTENGKPLLTTVPAQWEQRGTLYWPRKNASILIKAEESIPDKHWKSMHCILKRHGIPDYDSAENQIALMSDMSDTDTDHEIAKTHRPSESSSINFNELVTNCLSENNSGIESTDQNASIDITAHEYGVIDNQLVGVIEVPYDEANETGIPGTSQEKLNTISQKLDNLISVASSNALNIQALFDSQQNILQKLALIDTKLEEFVTRISVSDINRQGNNDHNFKIISNLQDLTSFEESLSNPQVEENIMKLLSVTCAKGKGRALNNAYALADVMFTRKFMTQCSWAGGTRGEPKICFKAYAKTISLFFKIIHQSDSNFTMPECQMFFKNIMRHAIQRNEAKLLRASAQKNRAKNAKVMQENKRQSDFQNVEQENTSTSHQKENVSPLDSTS